MLIPDTFKLEDTVKLLLIIEAPDTNIDDNNVILLLNNEFPDIYNLDITDTLSNNIVVPSITNDSVLGISVHLPLLYIFSLSVVVLYITSPLDTFNKLFI